MPTPPSLTTTPTDGHQSQNQIDQSRDVGFLFSIRLTSRENTAETSAELEAIGIQAFYPGQKDPLQQESR